MYVSISAAFCDHADELRQHSLAVKNLLGGMRAGYHHLVMKRELVDCAVEHCDLSEAERQLLISHVRPRYTIAASEMRSTSAYIDCIRSAGVPPHLPNNARAIHLRHFEEPLASAPTRLIVEDIVRDRAGVEMLLDVYLRYFQHGGRTRFAYVHGGGSTTAATFRAASQEPRPVMCTADSDRRCPNGPIGDTARAILLAKEDAPYPTAEAAILPVREMENAIPLRATRIIYTKLGSTDVADSCQTLIDFCEENPSEVERRALMTAYLDFKEGLSPGDVQALRAEFADELRALWIFVNNDNACPDLADGEYLVRNPFSGIAQNLLQVVSETFLITPHVLRDIARNFKKLPLHEEMLAHIKLISDFGAAPSPIPVRI